MNVTTRKTRVHFTEEQAESDKIESDEVSDVTPPPPPSTDLPSATGNPQLNPFTPEWFAQIIGAEASAAATAAVRADRPRNPAPVPVPAAAPAA